MCIYIYIYLQYKVIIHDISLNMMVGFSKESAWIWKVSHAILGQYTRHDTSDYVHM